MPDEPGRVRVDWAVESKHPGVSTGYAVLAGSLDAALALRMIEAGTTGTPAGENPGQIDALPWVSFTAADEPTALLGVLERSWSAERDATSRPIAPSRLLAVRWPSSKAALPGFVGLLALARSVRWTGVDEPPEGVHRTQPLVGDVALLTVDRLINMVDDVGFDWALSAAVALLDGDQVAIVTPGRVLSLQQRVQVLDAICALLPYGCRAWISASTWAQDRSAHPVRLSFAERGRSEQRVINFEGSVPATPRNRDAAAYLAEMNLLRSEGFSPAKIVEHLTEQYEPLGPQDGALAVKHLKELRLVASTIEDINNGKGDLERVGEVLARFGWGDLSPANLAIIASFLVDTAGNTKSGRTAREVLRRRWAPEALQSYGDMVVTDLRDGNIERPRRRVATLTELGPTVRDEVVVAVLQETAPSTDPALAKRTVDLLVATKSLALQNVPAWDVLARCPELGAQLLQAMSDLRTKGKGAHFRNMVKALAAHQEAPEARWVGTVRSLLEGGQVDPDIETFPDPVLAVAYDVALVKRQLRRMLAVAWAYVLRTAYLPDARGGHSHLTEIAKQVAEGTTPLGPHAKAAATLLALGTEKAPHLDLRGDLRPLAEAWSVLPDGARAALGKLLPAAVLGKRMTPESFGALVAVTDALDPVDRRRPGTTGLWEQATAEVGQHLVRHPDLLPKLALDEKWANDLVRYAPQHAWIRRYVGVHHRASNGETTTTEIRDAYAELRRANAPAKAAVRAIAPWLAARGPDGLGELLRSFGPRSDNRPAYGEEIRLGAFMEPDLDGLGVRYERILQRQRREYVTRLWNIDQDLAANHEVMVRNNILLPDDLASLAVDTSAAHKPEKPGLFKRAINKVIGDD